MCVACLLWPYFLAITYPRSPYGWADFHSHICSTRTDRVLRLRETFLIQMNDFERLLEIKLRLLLDPVSATPAPPRGRAVRLRIDSVPAPIELTLVAENLAVPVEVFA